MWMAAATRGKDGKGHRGLGAEAQKSQVVENPLQKGEMSVGGRGLNPSPSLCFFFFLRDFNNNIFFVFLFLFF